MGREDLINEDLPEKPKNTKAKNNMLNIEGYVIDSKTKKTTITKKEEGTDKLSSFPLNSTTILIYINKIEDEIETEDEYGETEGYTLKKEVLLI